MPAGIIATVDNGFATLDFIDGSKRGPALAAIIEEAGNIVETITRDGPRRKYRIPAQLAEDLGLIDGDEGPRVWSAGADTGAAARTVASDPNVNPGGGENWHTPTDQYTSANKYVGKVSNAAVLHNRGQVFTGTASSFGGHAVAPTHRELIDYLKDNAPAATEVQPMALRSVASINNALTEQPGAFGDDPGARPDAGGQVLTEEYTTPETERVESSQDGQTNATLGGQALTEPTKLDQTTEQPSGDSTGDGGTSEPLTPPDTEELIEYPQGEPSTKWTRPELDAYALKVKGLDTTSLANKDEVLAAINTPQEG